MFSVRNPCESAAKICNDMDQFGVKETGFGATRNECGASVTSQTFSVEKVTFSLSVPDHGV